jgi:adenosine deaminase
MEQQWHEILLHNDTGDAAFHKGAPLLVEALQVISTVCAIPSVTRLGLHLRDAQQGSAADRLWATYTERHVYEEHAERIAEAAPLLEELRQFFQEQASTTAKSRDATEESGCGAAVAAVAELDGLLVPTSWAASVCAVTEGIDISAADAGAHTHTSSTMTASVSLLEQPLFSYVSFLRCLDRLGKLVSMGEAFSASEPRVKVLQSRFRLYRAYNGAREDEYHPTFGGGDIKRAPKCDVRRLETCMSAASVVNFIEGLRRDRPAYPLYAEEQMTEDMLEAVTGSSQRREETQQQQRPSSRVNISVEEALRRFFGTENVMKSERVITEEGLCLRPRYAADSTDHWLSLQRLADSGSNPRASLAGRLLQHVLSTTGGADGQGELLAQLIQPLLKRTLASGSRYDRLELELTVTGADPVELPRLARWCAQSGLLESCPGVFFRLLIVQDAYAGPASATTAARASSSPLSQGSPRYFDTVLKNIFGPIWEAYRAAAIATTAAPKDRKGNEKESTGNVRDAAHRDMQALLARTSGFSVSLTHAAAVQEMPYHGNPANQFPLPYPASTSGTPPDAFFVYHIWRNVQLLNAFLLASGPKTPTNAVEASIAAKVQGKTPTAATATVSAAATNRWNSRAAFTFTLHGGANSRTLFAESVLGLLLADAVVNPSLAFEWSPLTYLYVLTQRHIVLTPSRNRCSSASVKQALDMTAIPLAVQAGLHVSVATLDPLFYNTTNDALSEELMELTKQRGLANADVTEMCLHGLEASSGCFSWEQWRHLFGYAWPHARARFNQFASTQVSSLRLHHRACALEHELDLLFASVHRPPSVVVPAAGKEESVTRALQRERDPTLLQNLSSYRSHEAAMQYPRILIVGPGRAGPSEPAKRLMQAMATREAYQAFVVRADTVASSARTQPSQQKARLDSLPLSSRDSAALKPTWVDGVLDMRGKSDPGISSSSTSAPRFADEASTRRAMPTWRQFQQDIRSLRALASNDATVAKYANKRLDMLESKYQLHVALTNDDEENYYVTTTSAASLNDNGSTTPSAENHSDTAASVPLPLRRRVVQSIRGDAHNCVKVDVHCHMASGITAKSLLQFMRCKIRDHPGDVVDVDKRTGQPITLVKFFDEVLPRKTYPRRPPQQQQQLEGGTERNVDDADTAEAAGVERVLAEMPIAALQVHAGKATFHRFDRFNHRFSPMGMSSLRSLFLKTDNFMQGRYFAELIRGVFERNELEGNIFTENRLSIYGRSRVEWDRLSRWFVLHGMAHRTNSWMIQIPRLFHLYRGSGILSNFQEMLRNIFEPLWEASCFPERHPYLHFFLAHVSGFDSVDNESDREPDQTIDVTPAQWTSVDNPPFAYYMFYMWSNITTLNRYRASRGFSTFQFRPHAGESGDPDHMADVFFLADGIGHGINLDKRPVLQYLYYLTQLPLAVVPMSNNALFCRYKDHPLPQFMRRGLNVALGTDGALIFHRTEQPLLEEYGAAEALWGLSAADISELATSSVRTSGFPVARKKAWLGPLYYLRSVAGNDVAKSHVPQTRCAFRYEAYMEEVAYVQRRASCEMSCRAMMTPLEEELSIMDAIGVSREELLARRWAGASITEKVGKVVGDRQSRITAAHEYSQL